MWGESEQSGWMSAANERAGIMSDLLLAWALAEVSGKSALYYIIYIRFEFRWTETEKFFSRWTFPLKDTNKNFFYFPVLAVWK